jgi:hypothetical protein
MFLARTIEDILANVEADTEVIALLDGQWADPPIPQNDRVNVIYIPEAIGQRAATNLACKMSKAKYVMKVDAHCGFDKGFDRKMIEAFKETGDNVTMIPTMRNLWAFDWKCYKCGWKKYQGPTPTKCDQCGDTTHMRRKMIWKGKERPQSNSYCFDAEPHFQYNEAYKHTEEYKNGAIIGYKLSFNKPSLSSGIINLLTDFTNSHHFSGGLYHFWGGEDMTMNAMSFPSINNSGSIGTPKVFDVGDELKMNGIATSPIFTEVVKDRDSFSSTSRQGGNQPSIGDTVCESFFSEPSTPSVTTFINSSSPIPTTRKCINSDVIKELNNILGGEFVYNEKTSSFHNESVALTPIYDKKITETMSIQGSCFMMTREKYWELDICGEEFGSWGNQGIEVACKTWLSGGRVLVNHKTWYAHMFRTQGGDFGFPYPQSGKQVANTKKKVKDLFWDSKWDKSIRPLSWLVERFWPVTGWTEDFLNKLKEQELKK